MQAEECITGRRSVRKYADRPVTDAVLREVVDLARFAPSWKNTQAVRYHLLRDPEKLAQVAEKGVSGFAFNAKTISRCKALVLLTVQRGVSGYEPDGSFSTAQQDRWEAFDAGAAAQTFCLAAHAKGLGSVILGIFDEPAIRAIVPLPRSERLAALIALGYPLEAPKAAPPRKEVDELLDLIG